MSFIVVIPARYQSTRLPGKPLLDIAGKPMLQHVVERAQQSKADAVYVATDDERIKDACQSINVNVVMTCSAHQSGTDRIEEVSRLLELDDDDIIVNVQGDEPMLPPEVINQVAEDLARHSQAQLCTLYEEMSSIDDIMNPNAVKVVMDNAGFALYFSRAPIPYPRGREKDIKPEDYKRHVGIYGYRVKVLHDFVSWPRNALEESEQLEQLRALANHACIHVQKACAQIPAGVDTQQDLDAIRALLAD